MTKNKKMKTEDIIKKQDEVIKILKDYIHVGGQESDYVGYLDKVHKLEFELSSLKSMRDEKEENATVNYFEIPELTDEEWLAMPKEEILQLYKDCYKMLMDFYKGNLSAFEQIKSQSSPQPQPGRGAEEILKTHLNEYIKTVHATEMIRLVGLNILMSKPYIKHILKAMEEYRTQSEGKIYPKWISVNERLPEESCTVLVVTSQNKVGEMWFSSEYKWHVLKDFATVTHWMPLPEPPKSLVK